MERIREYLSIATGQSLGKVISTLLIFIVGWIVIKQLSKVIYRAISKGDRLDPSLEKVIAKSVHGLLIFVLLTICMGQLGLPSTSLITVLGSLGLAASLAFQDSLKNIAGGIIIMSSRPFVTGDSIEAPMASGRVAEIGLVHTMVVTPDNRRVYVPNGVLASATVVNCSREVNRRIELIIPVPYSAPTAKARSVIEQVLAADPLVLADPAPDVRVWEVSAAKVDIAVKAWAEAEDFASTRSTLLESIKIALDKNGITG